MQPARRILLEWCLVALAVTSLVTASALGNWLWRIDLQLHDIALTRSSQLAPDPQILIIAIDDDSLARIGQWPWPRSVHARLVERLHASGTAAAGLDIIFSEPAADDATLARALRDHGRVVLPVHQREQGGRITGEIRPVPVLEQAAAALGHIQMEFDPDGIARSVYLNEGWERPAHAQFALALQQLAGAPAVAPEARPTENTAAWQRRNWLRIPFAGPPGSFAQVSYADVLDGRIDAEQLRGKLVLVGATALGLADSVPVPTSGFSRPMAGVEVHANVLSALRQGKAVRLAPPWLQALFSAVLPLALLLVLSRSRARSGLVWALAACTGVLLAAWAGVQLAGVWIGPAAALLGCVLAYPLWSWRRLETIQRFVDAELLALQRETALLPPATGLDPLQRRLAILRAASRLGREAQRLVEAVVEHLPVGVIALHADGRVRLSNSAARHLLGAQDADTLAAALRKQPWPSTVACHDGLPLAPTEACQLELRPAGSSPLLLTLAPLGDGNGGGLVIGLDDLGQVEAAHQAREDTLRFVTHDLRAPLASVIGLIDVAPEQVELLPAIRRIATEALELIDQLFRLSRAEAADTSLFQPLDLCEVMHDASSQSWAQAQAARVRIVCDTGGFEEAWAHGGGELLRRALGNLLSNAIKYGGEGQTVELTLQADTAHWRISVRDHGPGIPPPERARLFQRFGRLPGAIKRGLPGTGLGLLMVRTVAERHGGQVVVDYPADGGCCFSLLLPRISAPQG